MALDYVALVPLTTIVGLVVYGLARRSHHPSNSATNEELDELSHRIGGRL
jgi:hypothetical protein